jgi:hypothetical protein
MRESQLSKRFMLPLSERVTGVVEVLAAAVDSLTAGGWPYTAAPETTAVGAAAARGENGGTGHSYHILQCCITVTLTNHKFYRYLYFLFYP